MALTVFQSAFWRQQHTADKDLPFASDALIDRMERGNSNEFLPRVVAGGGSVALDEGAAGTSTINWRKMVPVAVTEVATSAYTGLTSVVSSAHAWLISPKGKSVALNVMMILIAASVVTRYFVGEGEFHQGSEGVAPHLSVNRKMLQLQASPVGAESPGGAGGSAGGLLEISGEDLARGIANGLREAGDNVVEKIPEVTGTVMDVVLGKAGIQTLLQNFSDITSSIGNSVGGLAGSVSSMDSAVKYAVYGVTTLSAGYGIGVLGSRMVWALVTQLRALNENLGTLVTSVSGLQTDLEPVLTKVDTMLSCANELAGAGGSNDEVARRTGKRIGTTITGVLDVVVMHALIQFERSAALYANKGGSAEDELHKQAIKAIVGTAEGVIDQGAKGIAKTLVGKPGDESSGTNLLGAHLVENGIPHLLAFFARQSPWVSWLLGFGSTTKRAEQPDAVVTLDVDKEENTLSPEKWQPLQPQPSSSSS